MASNSGQQPHTPLANGQQSVAQQLALIASKRQQVAQQPLTPSVPHLPIGQHQNGKHASWTGFSGKTLWDWLQLLIIPVMLAVGGFWFTAQQNQTSLLISQKQHDTDIAISKQQHQTDLQIAQDQQQEATLNTYLDGNYSGAQATGKG
jgi:hypothetical protein